MFSIRIIIAGLASVFALSLECSCFQPADGMNLWRMSAEVAECVNEYGDSTLDLLHSTIDLLETTLCSVGNVTKLGQSDFAGPYTITQPGHYTFCESVTASTTLTIDSDDVVLNIGSYQLDGISIVVASDHKNITIKNGLIRNVSQAITVNSGSENSIIENIVFDTAIAGTAPYGIKIAAPAQGLHIKDVYFYDAAPQAIFIEGTVSDRIDQVLIEHVHCVTTNQLISGTVGTDGTIHIIDCDLVKIQDVVITDSYLGIDAIAIDSCDGVELVDITINSQLSPTSIAGGVHVLDSNNIVHENVSVYGEAFGAGFTVDARNSFVQYHNFVYRACSATKISGNGFFARNTTNAAYEECEASECAEDGIHVTVGFDLRCSDCITSNNEGSGLQISATLGCVISGHSSFENGTHGIQFDSLNTCTVVDAQFMRNTGNGMLIDSGSRNITVSGCDIKSNGAEGLLAKSSFDVAIDATTSVSNRTGGFIFNLVDDIVLTDCSAQNNEGAGFSVTGVNGGSMPSTPEGNTGRSPVIIENCIAIKNGTEASRKQGFYFTNVGGVCMKNCFASYNTGYGVHFDSGSWNIQVEGCCALSNGLVGFVTWDTSLVTLSLYNNRFRECYGGHNDTSHLYNPIAALSDYAGNNTPGTSMFPPIGAVFSSAEATIFNPLSILPHVFCLFQ